MVVLLRVRVRIKEEMVLVLVIGYLPLSDLLPVYMRTS